MADLQEQDFDLLDSGSTSVASAFGFDVAEVDFVDSTCVVIVAVADHLLHYCFHFAGLGRRPAINRINWNYVQTENI